MLFTPNVTYTEKEITQTKGLNSNVDETRISIIAPDYSQYDFTKSDRGFMLDEIDGRKVNPIVRIEGKKQYFTVTEQHLKLLQRLYISWAGTGYNWGVPTVNPKRPYGNSSMLSDVIDIVSLPIEYDENIDGYTDEDESIIRQLHSETHIALQILTSNLSIKEGTYVADEYNDNWTLEQNIGET
ncbi:MAG: hypothetical protein H8D45_20870 [Bacteroidetes bacterium]|nr:hypothetical protein [Bacteroidota bacterium]